RIFAFFGDAGNLERITPPELQFQILTPHPMEMRPGALIDYKLRLLGIPFCWQTEITEWNPPFHFVDAQRSGPYKQWIHRHTFQEEGGMTVIRDEVCYRLPFGLLGDIGYPFVRYQIGKIFRFREQAIRRILKSEEMG
ncbi:MAG: SRPBCC family protein, partial [Chthoniobacterales bacterium]